MAFACVRTDNLSGTVHGKDLFSLRYSADIENGNILAVGAHEPGEREIRAAAAPGEDTPLSSLALVASEEFMKESKAATDFLSDFINKAGSIIRGYRLVPGDIFSVTKEAFASGGDTAAVGQVAFVDSSTKMSLAATAATDSVTIGKVILLEKEWIVIEVA